METTARCPNPACRGTRHKVALSDEIASGAGGAALSYRLLQCERCRLAFVDPLPGPEVLAAFYPRDYAYHVPGRPDAGLRSASKLRVARWRYLALVGSRACLRPVLAQLVEKAARRDVSYSLGVPLAMPRSARILDYGFGDGSFLLTLQRLGYRRLHGWDIELNRENAQRLAGLGIEASQTRGVGAFPEGSFDLVRLEHVFEHLASPQEALNRIVRWLRPGGILVMTLPSIDAWEPVEGLVGSPHLAHLQLPIHVMHHSEQSVRGFLDAAGLEVMGLRLLRPFRYLSVAARRSSTPASKLPSP